MTLPAPVRPPRPVGVELLVNLLLGPCDDAPGLPTPRGIDIRAALGEAVLPALQRSPCVVSFSGGRDSSAVLAIATDVARRHGLPDPIPVSKRYRDAPETDESDWQDIVIEHLGLRHREVLEIGVELDALGPAATASLRRLGVRWPANAHFHLPVLELARGGSVLTGVGGDELLSTRAPAHVLVLHGRERPSMQAVRSLVAAALPVRMRALARRRRHPHRFHWLTATGQDVANRALALDDVDWPGRWDAAVRQWYRTRAFAAMRGVLPELGEEFGVEVTNPLIEANVLAEATRVAGATGFHSRAGAMKDLVGDLLPSAVLDRQTKAAFSTPFWGPATRAFAAEWDGTGLDERLVDVEALRAEWLRPTPDAGTGLLLHAAWAATDRDVGSAQSPQ